MTGVRRAIEKATDGLAVVLFAIMFLLIVAQIVLRSMFNAPLIWSEELARYLFVWVALLGWVIASRRRTHLGVDILLKALPDNAQRMLQIAIAVATILFALVLVWNGAAIVERNADVETVTLFFTFGLVYAAAPLAGLLIGAYAVRDLLDAWMGRSVAPEREMTL